jgi:hypothetical protein
MKQIQKNMKEMKQLGRMARSARAYISGLKFRLQTRQSATDKKHVISIVGVTRAGEYKLKSKQLQQSRLRHRESLRE